jgi:chromosome segregation ATPase
MDPTSTTTEPTEQRKLGHNKLQLENEALAAQVKILEKSNQEKDMKLNLVRISMQNLTLENKEIKEKLETTKDVDTIVILEQSLVELQSEHDKVRLEKEKEIDTLRSSIDEIKAKMEQYVKESSNTVEQLEYKYSELKKRYTDLKDMYDKRIIESEALLADMLVLKNTSTSYKDSLDSTQALLGEYRTENARLRKGIYNIKQVAPLQVVQSASTKAVTRAAAPQPRGVTVRKQ